MEKDKRKLLSEQISKEKMEKSRNEMDQSVISVEDLSNEIFYEIFDYLDGCNVYQAFSNLNDRFQTLLNSSSLLFKITFCSTSKQRFIQNYKQMIRSNKKQILSIYFLSSIDNQIVSSLKIDSLFARLESLIFDPIEPNILISLLSKLIHLPRLFSLTINTLKTLTDLTDIYQLIFHLPKLKYIRFCAMESANTNVSVSLPININKQFSNIKYLIIDHPCSFNDLFSIISYTFQLNHLSFIHKRNSILKSEMISPFILSNLTYLSIYGDEIKFDECELFITKLNAKLKVLSLQSLANDKTYLHADRWEKLIEKYFPQLEKLYLTTCRFFDYNHRIPVYTGTLNNFNSLFWIKRQWLLQAEINLDNIAYSIHPYKKRWYEYDIQYQMIYSSNELFKSMRIIFTTIPYNERVNPYKRIISHISTVAEIYHLKIDEELYTDTLMEILVLLPALDSLQISSLLYSNPTYLTDENRKMFSLLTFQNQITKVYLKKTEKMEDIYFLIELCPRMTYLKVEFLQKLNIELFVRFILMKTNMECNHQLRLVCVRVISADDKMVEKLNKMIYLEKLLTNYTIKRISDNIYLRWK